MIVERVEISHFPCEFPCWQGNCRRRQVRRRLRPPPSSPSFPAISETSTAKAGISGQLRGSSSPNPGLETSLLGTNWVRKPVRLCWAFLVSKTFPRSMHENADGFRQTLPWFCAPAGVALSTQTLLILSEPAVPLIS